MNKNKWEIEGMYYESCRMEGHCPLWFGRNIDGPGCTNFETWEIKKGHINGVDISGIIIVIHQDGIGPKAADLGTPGGITEGAVYISDIASEEQKKELTPFFQKNMGIEMWGTFLGLKYVDIKLFKGENYHHTKMQFGEQKITLTKGSNNNAIGMSNPINTNLTNVKFGNADFWTFKDYGKDLVNKNTGGTVANFYLKGTINS